MSIWLGREALHKPKTTLSYFESKTTVFHKKSDIFSNPKLPKETVFNKKSDFVRINILCGIYEYCSRKRR